METTHENSRFRSQLLEKTRVLSINKLTKAKCKLSVISFTSLLASCQPSYAELVFKSNPYFVQELNKISYLTPPKNRERDYLVTEPKIQPSDVKKSHFTLNFSPLKIQERDYFLDQPKIQPIDTQPLITIQNGNSDFLTELKKINQLSFFNSFNCVDKVAVSGNNLKQEPKKLLNTVQYHHTLVDVFLCLSFASCLFTGELRLALALVRLWWGGHGNKPFIGRIPCAVCLRFLSLPTALTLGQSSKSLPLRKV